MPWLFNVPTPREIAPVPVPSRNVTAPVGIPPFPATTAVSVTGMPAIEGDRLEARAVTVVANWMVSRSEERRVEKECRSRWSPYH